MRKNKERERSFVVFFCSTVPFVIVERREEIRKKKEEKKKGNIKGNIFV